MRVNQIRVDCCRGVVSIVLGGNDGCNEIFRSSNALMPTCKRPDASKERNRGGGFKPINMDKVPELQLVAEYEIVVFLRQ
jgi:hypothetical protein